MGILTTLEASRISSPPNILVIDDDQTTGDALLTVLQHEGYRATIAATGGDGLSRLTSGEVYDLLLLDVMLPDLDGWTILSRIRAAPAIARIPIIMITAVDDERSEIELLQAGADDYLPKPLSYQSLMARIKALLRRATLQSINPLTGLPGNRQVEHFLQKCALDKEHFWAAAYVDIDSFKSYNDSYGFLQGDEVLKSTAEAIARAAKQCALDVFVGNIGGDDFIMGFSSELPRDDAGAMNAVKTALDTVMSEFNDLIKTFYAEPDLAHGYLEARNRRGEIERYPLMSVSIGVVTTARRVFAHPLEISNALVSVKRKAKSIPGSAVCFDQRRR